MKIIDKISDAIGNKTAGYLYGYLQDYTTKRGGNMPKGLLDTYDYDMNERYVWFKGNEDLIADFYKTKSRKFAILDTKASYYYNLLDSKVRIVHSGLPSLISHGKSHLLFSGGVKSEVYNDEENKNKNDDISALLSVILKENKIKDKLHEASITESWASKFAVKISGDADISDYPIIQIYNPLQYEAVYKYGRLQEIIFKNELDTKDCILFEHYGYGYIKYELFQKISNKYVAVNLTDIKETELLEDKDFDDNLILAAEKCILKSDYDGVLSEFDALDEVWSQLLDEIRNARIETYVPSLLTVGKTHNPLRKTFIEHESDPREGAINKIEHNQPSIRSDEYSNSIVAIRDNILANAGLSPLTLGIDDGIGANAAENALEKREIVSLRTRKRMVDSWTDFLDEFYNLLLKANDYINKKPYKEYFVKTTFGEYISPSRETKIDNAVKLISNDIIDNEEALKEVYGNELDKVTVERILSNTGNYTFGDDDNIENKDTEITEESIKAPEAVKTSLNGAQMQSLLSVLSSYNLGALSRQAAINLITSSLPLSQEQAEGIVEDNKKKK